MKSQLPPGPRMPTVLQTIGWWSRPTAFLERCRARYGRRFTIRLLGQSPFVVISDPDEIKELFLAPPDVLHPGEGARILEPVVGRNSVILLDEAPHLEQRKLLLPAFHGEKMQRLSGLMAELAEREVASWPRDETVALHPRLQRLTLEIILRAVFGLERGAQLDELRELLTEILAFGESPLSLIPPAQRLLAGRGPVARLERTSARVDELIFELIEERRREDADGEDVLTMLLAARHEDGSPMSPAELRDELMTALVAGHETTASQLAWAFERLAREPAVQARLQRRAGRGLRRGVPDGDHPRDPAPQAGAAQPRAAPGQAADRDRRHHLSARRGAVRERLSAPSRPGDLSRPYAFRPERFLERPPGTYTWIPFGGGRRRCLGASFALLEMKLVLRAVLARCELRPVGDRSELARRRGITISPSNESRVVLHERPDSEAPSAEMPTVAPAVA